MKKSHVCKHFLWKIDRWNDVTYWGIFLDAISLYLVGCVDDIASDILNCLTDQGLSESSSSEDEAEDNDDEYLGRQYRGTLETVLGKWEFSNFFTFEIIAFCGKLSLYLLLDYCVFLGKNGFLGKWKCHIFSWEAEGWYQYSKMFCWEPEGGYHCTMSVVIAPFWFSTEHLWIVIAPFWFSTEHLWIVI